MSYLLSADIRIPLSTPSLKAINCKRKVIHDHVYPTFTRKTFLNLQPRFIQPASANIYHHCMTTLKEQYSRNNVAAIKKGAVKLMVILSDKLFTEHQDQKIRVWKINIDENHRLARLPIQSDRAYNLLIPSISALALSKDGNLLCPVSWDRTLKIWRTSDFKCLESVANAHDDAINAVEASTDGSVITGSADRKIKVWRKNPGEKTHSLADTLDKHNSGINALAISVDGSVLFSGASDRSIVVWEKDGDSMRVVGAHRGHTKAILCVAVAVWTVTSRCGRFAFLTCRTCLN
uniref:Uncharacterized protein n=1 Tax=Kalanchoe fedtschenkoi TaxID=63787 RepID=A0A7N1A7Z9_KALFE